MSEETKTLHLKLWDGIRVTTESDSEVFTNMPDLFEAINMTGSNYADARSEITRYLYCFGHIDLTEAYGGHMVILSVVRNEKEEANHE